MRPHRAQRPRRAIREDLHNGQGIVSFINASDFHLERPMQDVLDLPDHLRRTLVDAPWKAAASIFEHALVENVDFVVLSGDLLNPVPRVPKVWLHAGPLRRVSRSQY